MYALVDCNNFYCSCERLFSPFWQRKPIIVLSNNDGCAISRSEEAKALGIKMGDPEHLIRDLIKKHGVIVRSSNYTLYDSISNRVMRTLASFVPHIELYSIDEAFLDMHNMPYQDLQELSLNVRKHCGFVGIPVCVGVAPTKTLAKMANRYAKKNHRAIGVFCADTPEKIAAMLESTQVEDIWGVGGQYAKLLHGNGYHTAAHLITANDAWIDEKMGVVGLRLFSELRGTPAIEWELETPAKKNICKSRSFGKLITDKETVNEALANYVARAAVNLRVQNSCTKVLEVFMHTNAHRQQDKQYNGSIKIKLPRASNDTGTIIKYASKALDIIFREGHNYVKCGCIMHDLVPADCIQNNLFMSNDSSKSDKLMKAMDSINKHMDSKDLVRMAVQGYEKTLCPALRLFIKAVYYQY